MTTDPVEGTMELGQQITKFMAILTRAGQGNNTASVQIAPDRQAMGGDGQTGALLATPAPIMARLVWDRLPQPAAHLPAVPQGLQSMETRDRAAKGLKIDRKAQPT